MERVINLLYDIEEKANQIIKRANEEKVKLHDKLEKDLADLDMQISNENEAKLNILKAQADEELAKEKQLLIEDCNKQLSDMEKHYQQNHDALVEKIFQGLIQA